VGAWLLAIFRLKQTLLNATIRWQASSCRGEAGLVFVGAWLLAIFRLKQTLLNVTIRWQASS
jgi:predicted neuraminidase